LKVKNSNLPLLYLGEKKSVSISSSECSLLTLGGCRYPNQLAWQVNVGKTHIRKVEQFKKYALFLPAAIVLD
jgi:hypothetical protein